MRLQRDYQIVYQRDRFALAPYNKDSFAAKSPVSSQLDFSSPFIGSKMISQGVTAQMFNKFHALSYSI
jgi:hypothetical protein